MEVVLDYGIRLFRHVVSQVFGNLGQAAKITAAPFVIFLVAAYLLMGDLFFNLFEFAEIQGGSGGALTEEEYEELFSDQLGPQLFRSFWLFPLAMVLFAWAAVAWHHYVLAEEYGGIVPQFSVGRVLGYVGRTILIFLLLILAAIPIMFVLGSAMVATMQSGGGFGLGLVFLMGLNFLFSWVLVRWSLILPAWSVDERMTIGESWTATKDVSGEILVPILGFAIIFSALQQLFTVLPGGAAITLISIFVTWIQFLVNLALLTTLYGNLVQGRPLN